MEREVIEQILAKYGVAWRHILPAQKGYRNASHAVVTASETLNLIVYKSEPSMVTHIKNANRVSDFLASKGFATRKARGGIMRVGEQTYAALYDYLPGKTIAWEAYTMQHLKTLGSAMGKMHTALQSLSAGKLPDVAEENKHLNKRMLAYFSDTHVSQALAQKLNLCVTQADFTKLLSACAHLPRQQALHMDFVRGNILFDGKKISGIIDFEKTAYGSPLFDLARTLAFLLVDCKYKPEEKVRKYFLQSGYVKRGGCGIEDSQVLEKLVDFFLLHDFYKFLRHNPYEYLPQNEHFVRTKSMLLKRMLITNV